MQFFNQSTNQLLLKKYFFIAFLGALLGISICYFILYSELQETLNFSFTFGFYGGVLGVFALVSLVKIAEILNKYFPWHQNVGVRLFVGFLVHFVYLFILIVSSFYIHEWFFNRNNDFFLNHNAAFIKLGIVFLIFSLIFEVIYFALYSYYSFSKFQIETVKQERKQIELQLNALKSQLSPHFLFNSLNTISSLIHKDEHKASLFVRKLASMYDAILKSYHQKLITIEEELAFLNSYNYLLETRFQDKYSCNIQIDDALLSSKIPPLTLQMLVENAVKHNQFSKEQPLLVSITSSESKIIITNNITKAPLHITSFNIGLDNINSRYLLLINEAISVIKDKSFSVQIPIIR